VRGLAALSRLFLGGSGKFACFVSIADELRFLVRVLCVAARNVLRRGPDREVVIVLLMQLPKTDGGPGEHKSKTADPNPGLQPISATSPSRH